MNYAEMLDWLQTMDPAFVTVADVQEACGVNRTTAWRRLKKAHKEGILLRKSVTFWNGMHYATRDYYTWVPYDQRSEFAARRARARLMGELRKQGLI